MKPEFLATQRPRCWCERRRGWQCAVMWHQRRGHVVGSRVPSRRGLHSPRMLHWIAQISRRRQAGLSLKTSCLQIRRHFARRTPVRHARSGLDHQRLQLPASAGDASADREAFDLAAGHATFRGRGAQAGLLGLRGFAPAPHQRRSRISPCLCGPLEFGSARVGSPMPARVMDPCARADHDLLKADRQFLYQAEGRTTGWRSPSIPSRTAPESRF